MTSTLPNKGTSTDTVKPNMDKPKIPNDPTKDESRSFLKFSRENLSISHSDLEQGFNKIRPRIRRDMILSLIAIFLALFCIGLEVWKIQTVVDNAREIEILKHDIESMKHRLLEEDLLDELKAFEEMYAEEDNDDDDADSDIDGDEYDSVYGDDEDEDDDDRDEDSKFSNEEYLADQHSASYSTDNSESNDGASASREDDLDKVLAALQTAEMKGARGDNRKKVKLDQKEERDRSNEEHDDDLTESLTVQDSDLSRIKRKRSVEKERPVGYNPSGVPIYAHGYLLRNRKNSTKNLSVPRLSLYENMMSGEKPTTENIKEESLIHHAVITSWDKHPPKKYYAQSRAPTSHVTPPPLYASRAHNPRQINDRRSEYWREEGPQALIRKDETDVNRQRGRENLKSIQDSRPLRRRGMTRRHLRGTRQIVAAHYAADSALFAAEDEHVGNGKGKHHEGIFKAWRPSDWMGDLGMSRHFTLSTNGQLTVQETGLYLIYAQIHYVDQHDENGFQVLVNDNSILQCMVYSPGIEHKSRSCFSAQATLLQSGDKVLLRDVAMERYTLFQQDKSFFGLVRLGDTRPPRQQQQN